MLATLATAASGQRDPRLEAAGQTVLRQLDAFRRDDFDTAYGFASRAIQRQFDRRAFEEMVRGGYPEIARSARASISQASLADNGQAYVQVHVHGANGKAVSAVYELVEEDGQWRINGVLTLPAEGAATR
jgi:Domain of unknown function (DUF4864)